MAHDGANHEILRVYSYWIGSSWEAMEADTSKYSGDNLIEEVRFIMQTGELYRTQNSYDGASNLTEMLDQAWDGLQWLNVGRVVSVYTVTECSCVCHADPSCDSVVSDIFDLTIAIDIALRGASVPPDPSPNCTIEVTDVDCSGWTDVIDVVKVLNVALRNANAATEYCDPCGAPQIISSRDTLGFYCYPFFATDTFTLANTGTVAGSFALSTTADWLAFDTGSGSIPAGGTVPVIATAYCTPPPSNQTWIIVRTQGVVTDSIFAWKVELP